MALCARNSGADSGRELFIGSKKSSSLHSKNFFGWGVQIFCEWRHKWRTFRPPWPTSPGPGLKPLDGSISLKFLLETRLQSESFDTWMTCWGFGYKIPCLIDSTTFSRFICNIRAIWIGIMWVTTIWICESSFQDQRKHDVAVRGMRKEIPLGLHKTSNVRLALLWICYVLREIN